MRFHYCDSAWVYERRGSGDVRVVCNRGVVWRNNDGSLILVEHLCENVVGHGEYQGRHLLGYGPWGSLGHSWADVRDGLIVFRDGDEVVAVSKVIGRCFAYSHERRGSLYKTFVRGYEEARDEKVVLHDCDSGEETAFDTESSSTFFIADDSILLCIDVTRTLRCVDLNGKTRWEFSYPGTRPRTLAGSAAWAPRVVDGRLFINACSKKAPARMYVDGRIYAIDVADGTVAWERHYDYQVEDCRVLDATRLVAFSDTRLVTLDMASGETLQDVETGLSRQIKSVTLAPIGGFVVVLSDQSQRILVFDATSLELVRSEDVAERSWHFPYEPMRAAGKLFVKVKYGRALMGLLVIDPEDIEAPLRVEDHADFDVRIPDGAPGPIEIITDRANLDDVLRLAEHLGMNAAYTNGNRGAWGENEAFDGRVILRCTGLAAPRGLALEQLDLLKRRFEHYAAEEFHTRSGTGERAVTFDYEML